MFGKSKNKKSEKVRIDTLVADTAYALDDFMSSGQSSTELLAKLQLSRKQVFEAVNFDDEVESCKEDLRTAMMASNWRLYGDGTDDAQIDRIYRAVRRQLEAFIELVLTARLNGYAVARYIYKVEADGFITLERLADRRDELDKYTPRRDGTLVYQGESGEELLNTQVLHLLLINRPTAQNPAGELAMARLYPAVSVRSNGWLYAHQFVKRYAQPYMVGKINGDAKSFVGKLYHFISGGALTLNTDESVELLQNTANGEAFEKLERMANARIQKVLLGKVKTSDLAHSSRAAQETEEAARQDRISAYLTLLGLAVQHAVDALVAVNAAYGLAISNEGGLWFEFEKEAEIDKARAERDKMYADTGQVRFTADYYEQVLGFEKEHFELVQPQAPESAHAALSLKLANPAPVLSADQTMMQPKMSAILSALQASESYADFQTALDALDLSEGDMPIIDKLVGQNVREWVAGSEGQP